tara:strand:- start:1398 stop:1931 length:534 start_codon:yes stop_codon:yes gene_type:complete
MNRYQFEDSISDYIENKLSLSKRKEFDSYLNENPEAKNMISSIESNVELLNTLPKSKVNKKFNAQLLKKINILKKENNRKYNKGTILGFAPMHATILSGLFASLIFLCIQLYTSKNLTENVNYTNQTPEKKMEPVDKINIADLDEQNRLNTPKDSIKHDSLKPQKKDFSSKIHLVND